MPQNPALFSSLSEALEFHLQQYFTAINDIAAPSNNLYDCIIKEVEIILLRKTLISVNGNQLKAAKLLGINRNTLRKKIDHYEIKI